MKIPWPLLLALSLALSQDLGAGEAPPLDTLALLFSRDADVGLSHGAPRDPLFTGLTVGLGRFHTP